MKIWMDFEFMEDGPSCTVIPLSGAYVASNDAALYIVITDADRSLANPFVVEHVLPYVDVPPWGYVKRTMQLLPDGQGGLSIIQNEDGVRYIRCPRAAAGPLIVQWVAEQTPAPEFWAWYGDYDWVCHAQLQGSMVDMPDNWPFFCLDFRQVCSGPFPKDLVDPLAPAGLPAHHALADTYDLRARHRWFLAQD